MKSLKKDLQGVSTELKVLYKKTERLVKVADKLEKAQAAMKKRTPKKKARLTATDQILNIIKKSKRGVGVSTLTKRTGFGEKKVRNILFRVDKLGKVLIAQDKVIIAKKKKPRTRSSGPRRSGLRGA